MYETEHSILSKYNQNNFFQLYRHSQQFLFIHIYAYVINNFYLWMTIILNFSSQNNLHYRLYLHIDKIINSKIFKNIYILNREEA